MAGAGNVYSVAGHYTLIRHFKIEFGHNRWRPMYEDLMFCLAQHQLCLGCELVTRCLGEHGAHPRTDHLILNAVLDRESLAACSPLLLFEFRERYRLQASPQRQLQTFDAQRPLSSLHYQPLAASMPTEAHADCAVRGIKVFY